MAPRTGRPLGEDGRKDKLLQIRVDQATLEKLDFCAKEMKCSRSEVIRKGIQLILDNLEK